MFRFLLIIILAGFLYLGFEFVSTYKTNNMSEAEIAEQIQQEKIAAQEAEESLQERREFIDKLLSPFWELETTGDQIGWWTTWLSALFAVIFLYTHALRVRKQIVSGDIL